MIAQSVRSSAAMCLLRTGRLGRCLGRVLLALRGGAIADKTNGD